MNVLPVTHLLTGWIQRVEIWINMIHKNKKNVQQMFLMLIKE